MFNLKYNLVDVVGISTVSLVLADGFRGLASPAEVVSGLAVVLVLAYASCRSRTKSL